MNEMENIREGRLVKGRVVRKKDGDIYVDIGYKSEGLVPKDETARYTYYDGLNEGDEIEVLVKRVETKDGLVILSKIIADKKAVFGRVKDSFKTGALLEGKVTKAVKGGFIIDFGANVTAFLPMSHARLTPESAVDKMLALKVIQLDEEKRNVVVSYKDAVAEQEKKKEELLKGVFPDGARTEVTIKARTEGGYEAERDGVAAFLPETEISWHKPLRQGEEPLPGSVVSVIVTGVEKGVPQLSIRRLTDNPAASYAGEHKPGEKLEVTLTEVTQSEALAEIGELTAVLPVNEFSWLKRIRNLQEICRQGDKVEAVITLIDKENGRVYLSPRQASGNDPWHEMDERYPVDARVHGIVSEVTEGFGVGVELEENIEALVKAEDVSWTIPPKLSDVAHSGDKRDFKIIAVDKQARKIYLGMKQLTNSPWTNFVNTHREGAIYDVRVADIEDNAIVCELSPGVVSRIGIKNKLKLTCKKGDMIKVKVVKIDKDNKKVQVTGRDLEITEEKKQLDEYMKTHEAHFKMNDVFNFGNKDGGNK